MKLIVSKLYFSLALAATVLISPLEIIPAFTINQAHANTRKSIRVVILPFRNITGKNEDMWLGDSFSESLTMGLLNVSSLQMIERSQISQLIKEQQFGQTGLVDEDSAPRLGKMLGAEIVILGSYQKVGDQLQANVRFVHVETGQIDKKWATQVEGSLAELFGLQRKLARDLITQMQIPSSAEDANKVDAVFQETKSTEAHRFYIEGLSKMRRGVKPQLVIRDYKAALREDPNYALAYSGLAEVHAYLAVERGKLVILPPSQAMQLQGPGDAALAMEYAEKALALNPELAQTWRALAWLEQNNGNQQRAQELSKKALLINPRDPDSLTTYINIRMLQGSIKTTILHDELKSLGANLDDPWLKFSLGSMGYLQEAFKSKPDFGWIEELLEEAAKALPDIAFIPLIQAGIPAYKKEEAKANEYLERAVSLGSDSPVLLSSAAMMYTSLENYQKSLALVEQALKMEPDLFAARIEKANILFATGKIDQAEQLYLLLEKERPEDTTFNFTRGMILLRSGQNPALAHQYLAKALKFSETNPQGLSRSLILNFLGSAYIVDKRLPEARKVYEELRSDPVYYAQAYEYLAYILSEQEDFQGALDAYTAVLKIQPDMLNDPDKKLTYSLYYLLNQNKLEPENIAVLNDLAQIALSLKNYKRARKNLSEGLKLNSDSPTLNYNLAYLEMSESHWPEALVALKKVIELKPDYLKAWFNLALVQKELKNLSEAKKALQRVLELDSTHAEARELLKTWMSL
jgi:tetratricopeptide (TPR) repeat protein